MKKAFLSSLIILFCSFISQAENVYVVGLSSDGISSEKAIWQNGELNDLSFLEGNLCGSDIDGEYVYYATYKKTTNSSNRDYSNIEISIYRASKKLYNFSIEKIDNPYISNVVVVNGNVYIIAKTKCTKSKKTNVPKLFS